MTVKHSGGYVELTRTLDSIRIGPRHRTDLGDLAGLTESIRQHGLLQPITVTPDGLLVSGARRLAALKALDYRTVSVWVRAVSGPYSPLDPEQEEDRHHEPLLATAAASSLPGCRQTRQVGRRQENHPADATDLSTQPADAPDPSGPGGASHSVFTRSGPHPTQSPVASASAEASPGAEDAEAELREELVRLHEQAEGPDTNTDDRRRLLEKAERLRRSLPDRDVVSPPIRPVRAARARRRQVTAADARSDAARFTATLAGLARWWAEFEPSTIAAGLTSEQWSHLQTVMGATAEFVRQVEERRSTPRR